MKKEQKDQLDALCGKCRADVIETLHRKQTGHPGGSLSSCEILTALYFLHASVDSRNPGLHSRDRVVLSKGHAAPMLYRILAEKGFFPISEMETLRDLDSNLQGHPCAGLTPGVDLSTGPLGIGLSAALGMALGLRLDGESACVYVVLGDGELNEGTIWEACMSAGKFKADNLIAIVDHNGVQLDGPSGDIMPIGDIRRVFEGFGWACLSCDGHDIEALDNAIRDAKAIQGKPVVILAQTVKGKGVSFMEGQNAWHGKPIDDESYQKAMAELGGGR